MRQSFTVCWDIYPKSEAHMGKREEPSCHDVWDVAFLCEAWCCTGAVAAEVGQLVWLSFNLVCSNKTDPPCFRTVCVHHHPFSTLNTPPSTYLCHWCLFAGPAVPSKLSGSSISSHSSSHNHHDKFANILHALAHFYPAYYTCRHTRVQYVCIIMCCMPFDRV